MERRAPANTGIRVETSSGNTPTPGDGTWSAWAAVTADGTIASPSARYIRYRVTFTTNDPSATAVLNDVALAWA